MWGEPDLTGHAGIAVDLGNVAEFIIKTSDKLASFVALL